MVFDFGLLLQSLTAAGLIWSGQALLKSSLLLAVHSEKHRTSEEKHKLTEKRLAMLERTK